jgi:hypothetical protein
MLIMRDPVPRRKNGGLAAGMTRQEKGKKPEWFRTKSVAPTARSKDLQLPEPKQIVGARDIVPLLSLVYGMERDRAGLLGDAGLVPVDNIGELPGVFVELKLKLTLFVDY